MTLTPRASAAAISSRTQSIGSSRRRRPAASTAVAHVLPMTATTPSQKPTFVSMTSAKSDPASIVSTSMKTLAGPNRAQSRA